MGASLCTESTTYSQGYKFQWGRSSDGHELSNSPESSVNLSGVKFDSLETNSNLFIRRSDIFYADWTTADDYGTIRESNWNVCPYGYRLPTFSEFQSESFLSKEDAFDKLKICTAKIRNGKYGTINSFNYLWTKDIGTTTSGNAKAINLDTQDFQDGPRTNGLEVRCIKK